MIYHFSILGEVVTHVGAIQNDDPMIFHSNISLLQMSANNNLIVGYLSKLHRKKMFLYISANWQKRTRKI